MRILDPTDERVPVRRSLAARPEGVIGTVGLLDINKARGDVMLSTPLRTSKISLTTFVPACSATAAS